MQLFYNLSDPALEDSLYEIESMRRFAGLRLSDNIPDETTILNFRHFLEKHGLGKLFLKEINKHLQHQGLLFREGTIVDASIISAPSSTKNQSRKRDPEMHSSKKGNQWHFGMKMHIGVDDVTGMIHSVESTAANVHDVTMTASLLHGEEKRVFGDAGYLGVEKRRENKERKNLAWLISARISKRKTMTENEQEIEKMKAVNGH
ncbi:MAG: IS5 family transposase [Thiopseudomonas sp.]